MDQDADLIAAFASSCDQAAFARLVERHQRLVLGTCRRMCGDDAEDAAQAVFLVLARKAGELARHPAIGAWLHLTATNIALRHRESAVARRWREREAAMSEEISEPDERDDAGLDEALRSLPRTYREPLVLHYLDGRDADETAVAIGITREALAMRLSRGRQLLRSLLERRRGPAIAGAVLAALAGAAGSTAEPGTSPGFVQRTADEAAVYSRGESWTLAARLASAYLARTPWLRIVGAAAAVLVIAGSAAALIPRPAPRIAGTTAGTAAPLPVVALGSAEPLRARASVVSAENVAPIPWHKQSRSSTNEGFRRSIDITTFADAAGHHLLKGLGADRALLSALVAVAGERATVAEFASTMNLSLPVAINVESGGECEIRGLRSESGSPAMLSAALDGICDPLELAWSVDGDAITIRRRPAIPDRPTANN